jgi:glyoxylase-like metal-dependent hydrolase (beta-lactamase superfamily II)
MKLKTFPLNPFEMNCYVYYDENSGEGVIIDPGAYTEDEKKELSDFISSNNIQIKYILNTHGHIDHVMGNRWAKDTFSVPLYIHKEDMPLLDKAVEQGEMFGIAITKSPEPDKLIDEGETIKFGDCTFDIIHTPGHSPGGLCFVDDKNKIIIAGDTIFHGSIGRTDLPGGDMEALINSIKTKIFQYADDFALYPGHYEQTTVGEEKSLNPFLQ